jgi:replication factor C subunit 1
MSEQQKKKNATFPVKSKPVEVKDIHNIFGTGPAKRTERSKLTNGSHNKLHEEILTLDDDDVLNENILSLCNEVERSATVEIKKKSPQKTVKADSPKKAFKDPPKSSKKAVEKPFESKNNGLRAEKIEAKVKKNEESAKKVQEKSPKKNERSPPKKDSAKKLSQTTSLLQSQPTAPMPKPPPELSFVDKYKPTNAKQIIGQQGPQSAANKLQNWLLSWYKNHGDSNKKHAKPNPWAKDNDGSAYKAALLSGAPGVGKTTTAHLVCDELMFDVVEFNASDTRSKKLLKEEVSQLLSNKSLKGYTFGTEKTATKRHVLIMDEVDGMAGNEDRGGIAELILLIKESRIPIICMCNDRAHPKMRSLVNHCFDLRFNKPSINQIRSSMMSICFKEGIKMDAAAIDSIISGTGNDIRQTLNHLALYSASKDKSVDTNVAKRNASMSEKDIKIVITKFSFKKKFFHELINYF